MKSINITSFVLLIFMFIICNTLIAQVEMVAKLKGGEATAIDELVVSFEILGSHVIPVDILINNNEESFKFIFDTAGMTMINKELPKQLKMKIDTLQTPNGPLLLSRINTINCGGLIVKNFNINVTNFQETFAMGDIDIWGMIGPDFFRFYRTTIDYQNKQLIFGNNDVPLKAESSEKHLFDMELKIPYHPSIKMEVNSNIPIYGRIDTGLFYAYVFPKIFIEHLTDKEKENLLSCQGFFVKFPFTKEKVNYLSKIKTIKMGDIVLKDVGVIFSDLPFNNTALLGKDFLENYRTTLDFENRKVLLADVEDGYNKDILFSTGLNLRKGKEDSIIVKGIWENSPASQAGIKIGDKILSINGITDAEITSMDLYNYLYDTKFKKLQLQLEDKNSKKREITLEKRYLL